MKTAEQLVTQAKHALKAGDFQRCAQLCRKALRHSPCHIDALHLVSLVALQQRDYAAAAQALQQALSVAPGHGVLLSNLAAAQRGLGQIDAALASLERAAEADPANAVTQFNLGMLHAEAGQFERAEHCLRSAARIAPEQAEIHLNLGNVLHSQGRVGEAMASYDEALSRNSAVPGAHYNRGCALEELGQASAAADAYRQALQLDPSLAPAHFNLTGLLVAMGAQDEARQHLQQALRIQPQWPEAHARLGALLAESGDFADSLAHFHTALTAAPNNAVVGRYFAHTLARMPELDYSPELAADLVACLKLPGLDYQPVTSAAVSILKQAPGFAALESLVPGSADAWAAQFTSAPTRTWLASELLQRVLRQSVVADAQIEALFSALRRYCLERLTQEHDQLPLPEDTLLESLAHQCFINEYAYAQSAHELDQLERVKQRITAALDRAMPVRPADVLVLAMYRGLHTLPGAQRLLGAAELAPHAAVLELQIAQPLEEARLRQTIAAVSTIDDTVSQRVREQYEESPYPRWMSLDMQPARSLRAVLRELFPDYEPSAADTAAPQILVAGCGTGRHAIAVAQRFAGAKVLAVDLSRASLAYAMRMATELNVANIEFAQADILKLGALTQRFDVIESAGVLHHMADPLAGWRQLRTLLKPGGLMRIGLYSTRARRDIEQARGFVTEAGYSADADGIRRARQTLLALEPSQPAAAVTHMQDFYSLSSCRDLIFHVQERSYTPAEIGAALDALHLRLIGFELAQRSQLHAFRQMNPGAEAMNDLNAWDRFEAIFPDTFSSMYQFWCEDTINPAVAS
ncbi:MAG: hypothetical protein AMS22_02705 [Thiotrichales bacterium SG8_50]|nr:MAG: hypothetical protein AMS22_02705 [Thiotrichales bacterium SG8_50]